MASPEDAPALELVYSFDPPNEVFLSSDQNPSIGNRLQLNITHPSSKPLVQFENAKGLKPGDKLPSIHDTDLGFRFDRINIYFLWGDGTNELCTLAESTGIRVSAGPNTDDWYASKIQSGPAVGSYWILYPKTSAVLEGQEHIAFLLDNIISTAKPGAPLLYVRAIVQGYETETITPAQTFTKDAPLQINSFTIVPNTPINQGDQVKLYWSTWSAAYCKLNDGSEQLPANMPITGAGHAVTPRIGHSTYALTAYSRDGRQSEPVTHEVSFNPPKVKAFNITADPVTPGQRLSFTLNWKLLDVTGFTITANDGPGGSERTLPVPPNSNSFPVYPTQLQTRYTMTISDDDARRLADAETPTAQVTATIQQMTPVGSLVAYYGDYPSALPPGWLPCNGESFPQATYPELYAFLGNSDKTPDLAGYFLRALDASGKIDTGPPAAPRKIRSIQADEFARHTHRHHPTIWKHYRSFEGDDDGAHPLKDGKGDGGSGFDFQIGNSGGTETRPKNVAVNYIIFAGLPKS